MHGGGKSLTISLCPYFFFSFFFKGFQEGCEGPSFPIYFFPYNYSFSYVFKIQVGGKDVTTTRYSFFYFVSKIKEVRRA